jgi:hypothetical protein
MTRDEANRAILDCHGFDLDGSGIWKKILRDTDKGDLKWNDPEEPYRAEHKSYTVRVYQTAPFVRRIRVTTKVSKYQFSIKAGPVRWWQLSYMIWSRRLLDAPTVLKEMNGQNWDRDDL